MRRAISGFVTDEEGDWVAELSCGHDQHVRHRPPFQDRAWVEQEDMRLKRVGTYLLCPLCDRAELPRRCRLSRTSPTWDETTMPAALTRSHRLAEGAWGVIKIESGLVGFVTQGEVVLNVDLVQGSSRAIPPGLDHLLEVRGSVLFAVDFFSVEPASPTARPARDGSDAPSDEGGDSACWARLVCSVCGEMLEGELHEHDAEFEQDV